MPVEVKICGLKTPEALNAALHAGADYVGLVFYPRSPRNVTPEQAADLAGLARGKAKSVALLVDPDDALVAEVVRKVAPDLLQLHGEESPERVRAIKASTGLPVMKAVAVATTGDVAAAARYEGAADMILFDAKPPRDRADSLPGGNGLAFDWRILAGWRERWYMLSGGLTPETVAGAIELTGARAVDVSSGVERAPGDKDPDRIAHFIRAAKSARTT